MKVPSVASHSAAAAFMAAAVVVASTSASASTSTSTMSTTLGFSEFDLVVFKSWENNGFSLGGDESSSDKGKSGEFHVFFDIYLNITSISKLWNCLFFL